MPDSTTDDVYSAPQINIPPTFPFILKQYAKAAIRTQPYDLLRWSAAYFRALAKGEEPPIKDRLEYPPPDTPSGLSPGYLKVLIKQIGKGGTVTVNELVERWNGICLAEEPLQEMLAVGQFGETFDWLHFVAVAAGFLSNNLTQTMVLLCNLLTDEPDGGSAMIPLHTFANLYTFLASLDCGGGEDPEDEDESHHEYVLTEENKEAHPEARLETFYDAKPKGSHHSSQELTEKGKIATDMQEPQPDPQNNEKRSISLIEQSTVNEPKIKSSASVPSSALTTTMKQTSSGRGDSAQVPTSIRKRSSDGVRNKRHIPGIGALVDAIQIQAVINYLEGVALKQDGMIKPSNIRHFLCPPLEKVPASQKTRV
ncbi:ropporin-1-like protein isoform X3 [Thrips palmi]|uniref:Ropporin-1-like protein isoform X3 n=1 Tax=Thrips palmi TaxID=161013 RepID=A0A6P8YAJ7_THRPL|nr:ropporin-1-like protein isoform X3 [Thrips palmi]